MSRSAPEARGRRVRAVGRRAPARRERTLSVWVTDAEGRPVSAAGLARWLERAAPRDARGVVTVALVSDARIRQWNRRYRGVDAVTDVLAFPASDQPGRRRVPACPILGDIAIATGRARRQARQLGHRYAQELRVLALHGLLHLLGYDHHHDEGRMARLERRLCRRAGLAAGLLGRT
jgi:probable rRNA maturation factor